MKITTTEEILSNKMPIHAYSLIDLKSFFLVKRHMQTDFQSLKMVVIFNCKNCESGFLFRLAKFTKIKGNMSLDKNVGERFPLIFKNEKPDKSICFCPVL